MLEKVLTPKPTLKDILETAELIETALLGPGYSHKEAVNIKSNYINAMRKEFEKTAGKQDFESVEIVTLAIISEVLSKRKI